MCKDTCSFCLGTDTDIPSFGTLHDAQDLVHPCRTCSIVTHRKCLLDWFNSIPVDELVVASGRRVAEENNMNLNSNSTLLNEISVGGSGSDITSSDGSFQFTINAQLPRWLYLNNTTIDEGELVTEASLTTTNQIPGGFPTMDDEESEENTTLEEVVTATTTSNSPPPVSHIANSAGSSSDMVFIIVPCPQCKQQIIFVMRRSRFITFQNSARLYIKRLVQYGGVFLIITSALTGVLSLGYVGLTTCGLKMMDWMVPGSVVVQMLTKTNKKSRLSNDITSSLKKLLFGEQSSSSYAIDNLETALVNGLIDPFKFARIPTLPIVLYQMRSSSIVDCFFGKDKWSSIYEELMFVGYFSNLGDNELLKGVIGNVLGNLQNPFKPRSLFSGINLFKINNLISLIIPVRWTYDLLYRLTFNRMYFNLAMKVQPREIANHLSQQESERLELINSDINELKLRVHTTNDSILSLLYNKFQLLKSKNYIQLKIMSNYYKTIACLKYDYSNTLSHKSKTIKSITTIIWPYLSSKIGKLLLKLLTNQTSAKNIIITNIIGMIIVAVIKEVVNLWIGKIKANQRSQIETINDIDIQTVTSN
ncbi:hypothetical protein JA1_001372 [Spathaspora sp. JA1]|nr:hypothetical protein JA1_001372 [Spathaspora sp. JA1]